MIRTDDVAHLAEQATLGGLLLEPKYFSEVNAWVRGQDFDDPWHRQVWSTLREAHTHGTELGPEVLAREMLRRCGPRLADIVRIHDLLQAVPKNPDPRPHARIVVDCGVRREIAGLGVLLEAAALAAATHFEGRPFRASMRIVGAALLVAGERWADANGETIDGLSDQIPTQLKANASDLELRRTADKFLAQSPALDADQARANEARLIACLVSHPTAIAPTQAWLRPARLTNRPWRTVYIALEELADRGQSVDVVSLATTVLRVSRRTGSAPDLADMLAAVGDETYSVPGYLRRFVAADQLRLLAHAGAHALREGAANPGAQVVDLLDTGTLLVQSLCNLASALPDSVGQDGTSHLSIGQSRNADPDEPSADHREGPVAG